MNDTRGQVVTHSGQRDPGVLRGVRRWALRRRRGRLARRERRLTRSPTSRRSATPARDTAANPWTDWQKSYTARGAHRAGSRPYTGAIGTVRGFPKVRRGEGGRIITRDGAWVERLGARSRARSCGGRSAPGTGASGSTQNKNITGPIRDALRRGDVPPGPADVTRSRASTGGSRQQFQTGGDLPQRRAPASRSGSAARSTGSTASIGGPNEPTRHAGVADRRHQPRWRYAGPLRAGTHPGRSAGSGTHALWGRVLAEYLDRGGTDGSLGFPTSRVRDDGGGGTLAALRARHHRVPRRAGGAGSPETVGSAQQSSAALGSGAFVVHANASLNPSRSSWPARP